VNKFDVIIKQSHIKNIKINDKIFKLGSNIIKTIEKNTLVTEITNGSTFRVQIKKCNMR
jgi:hypothetical protein